MEEVCNDMERTKTYHFAENVFGGRGIIFLKL